MISIFAVLNCTAKGGRFTERPPNLYLSAGAFDVIIESNNLTFGGCTKMKNDGLLKFLGNCTFCVAVFLHGHFH